LFRCIPCYAMAIDSQSGSDCRGEAGSCVRVAPGHLPCRLPRQSTPSIPIPCNLSFRTNRLKPQAARSLPKWAR